MYVSLSTPAKTAQRRQKTPKPDEVIFHTASFCWISVERGLDKGRRAAVEGREERGKNAGRTKTCGPIKTR